MSRGSPFCLKRSSYNTQHDASSLGDSMVFRIYTFVMRMSHNLTKSDKIFSKKKSKTPRVTLYITVLYASHIFSMRETRHHGLCGGGPLRLARYVKYYRQRPQTCT